MPRQPKPDPAAYLRLILGISISTKILAVSEQNRLDLAVSLVTFIAKTMPGKPDMSEFLKDYAAEKGVSRSFCYKVKAMLEELTIMRFDDYWKEYRLNMERWKRDKKALTAFKAQVGDWARADHHEI